MPPQSLCTSFSQGGLQPSSPVVAPPQQDRHTLDVFFHMLLLQNLRKGTANLMMKAFLVDGDQNTKSGLRVVATISGGKAKRWPTSANIYQSQAVQSWLFSAVADPLFFFFAPSHTNVTAGRGLVPEVVFELFKVRLSSRVVARLFRTWLWCQV